MSYDYSGWISRLQAFLERVRGLPGKVTIKDNRRQFPAERVLELAGRLPTKVPEPLLNFYTDGAAECFCGYTWEPSEPTAITLKKLFPPTDYVFGGLKLCGIQDMHQGTDYLQGLYDTAEGLDGNGDYEDAKMWAHSFPFHDCGNGDYLAIYLGSDWPHGGFPVVYLNHDGRGSPIIAPNFDNFLEIWQGLYYLEPAAFLLGHFTDYITGYLHANSRKKEELDKFWGEVIGKEKGSRVD